MIDNSDFSAKNPLCSNFGWLARRVEPGRLGSSLQNEHSLRRSMPHHQRAFKSKVAPFSQGRDVRSGLPRRAVQGRAATGPANEQPGTTKSAFVEPVSYE
jgi:hypothetical protein